MREPHAELHVRVAASVLAQIKALAVEEQRKITVIVDRALRAEIERAKRAAADVA